MIILEKFINTHVFCFVMLTNVILSMLLGLSAPESIDTKKTLADDINSINIEESFSNSMSVYDSLATYAFDWSKEHNDYAVLIDKNKRQLYLFHNGSVDTTFKVGLGFNPVDDKLIEGDGCTPEGIYYVSMKKNVGQTHFYKAFLLDYPNKEDWQRFNQAKKKGLISSDESIGGLIEVHGCGSSIDWTLGCVALNDSDMDYLFPLIKRNYNPIVVIGTTNQEF